MSETKFTPGPWNARWICNNDWSVAGPKPPTYMSEYFTEADARLMAAAPNGYALAEEIVNHLYLKHDIARVRRMARDFIAKVQQ